MNAMNQDIELAKDIGYGDALLDIQEFFLHNSTSETITIYELNNYMLHLYRIKQTKWSDIIKEIG